MRRKKARESVLNDAILDLLYLKRQRLMHQWQNSSDSTWDQPGKHKNIILQREQRGVSVDEKAKYMWR